MVSSREGDSSLPSLGRCGTGALPTPITTMPWMENAPAIQVMMMVPPWTAAPQPDTRLPFEQWCARQEGQRAQARAWQPSAKQKAAQWWNKLVGKQTTTIAPSHESPWHEPLLEAKRTLIVYFASTHARAKGVASSTSHEGGGGAARGYGSQAPECLTSTHDRWGGQVVPSTSGDPCHRYHITSGVRPLALS
jgi:hypothetical protein